MSYKKLNAKDAVAIPAEPAPILYDATVVFDTPIGPITYIWNAETGVCTCNEMPVQNTNNLADLHTNAKAIVAHFTMPVPEEPDDNTISP